MELIAVEPETVQVKVVLEEVKKKKKARTRIKKRK